jgi:hypothetical protein
MPTTLPLVPFGTIFSGTRLSARHSAEPERRRQLLCDLIETWPGKCPDLCRDLFLRASRSLDEECGAMHARYGPRLDAIFVFRAQ